MKRLLLILCTCCTLATPSLAEVNLNVNLNLGVPPAQFVVSDPPVFLTLSPFGLQVAIGIPYDMFYIEGRYYVFRNNVWHVGSGYNGPWQVIHHKHLPPGLAKHHYKDLIREREREYERYRHDGDHYRGKTYRPEREHRKEKDDRNEGRGHGKKYKD